MSRSPHPRTDGGPRTPAPAPGGAPARAADRSPQIRPPLDVVGPATGATAAWARWQFGAWLALDLAAGDLFDDLVLVVYEALANAADHAYPTPGAGPVRLCARRTRHAVHITVSDHGTWRDVSAAPTSRGRGLFLIRQLVPCQAPGLMEAGLSRLGGLPGKVVGSV